MSTMRAICVSEFGDASVLKYTESASKPTITRPTQILIRVHSAGVNPVETITRSGSPYPFKPSLPYIPGGDAAGVVEAVGEHVNTIKPGDRVFCWGAAGSYAEFCVSEELTTWPLPDHLSFSQGASLGIPYFTAYKALFLRCHVKSTDTVLVHGASGAVGQAVCQLCRSKNIKVLGTASSTAGRELVEANGAKAFDHSKPDYVKDIMTATDGDGVDVIIEMLANV